jgi:hypothetical protein
VNVRDLPFIDPPLTPRGGSPSREDQPAPLLFRMPGAGDSNNGFSISGFSILGNAKVCMSTVPLDGVQGTLFCDFSNHPMLTVPHNLDASIGKLQSRPTCRSRR